MWLVFAVVYMVFKTALCAVPIVKTVDPTLSWKIIGGNEAPDGLYPYQVSLRHKEIGYRLKTKFDVTDTQCLLSNRANGLNPDIREGYHTCGGSIISPEYILTAAHCVSYESAEDFYVVVGSTKLNSGGTVYAVTELHWHDDFSIWHGQNDIAILRITPPITYERGVVDFVPVETVDIPPKETVILSGWGTTDGTTSIPNNLQHIHLTTVDRKYCESLHTLPVSDSQVCTSTEKGKGACKGDSGGPLVKIYDSGETRQVGIVSFGRKCAEGYPDVYTRTASHLSWIREKCNNCI